jgi:hypothetical protein
LTSINQALHLSLRGRSGTTPFEDSEAVKIMQLRVSCQDF